ncbi:hypothetical protein GCM10014713_23480 [Streptomyces purpureus]|uniref:Uncharacterized protein n=1 Tax=Streptomyces purpureus TaxID=1951 RepID=A0A918H1I7_9ACTN|nr:hypothetical protein GCM10014713_23480 [Streptomyces purpureus]
MLGSSPATMISVVLTQKTPTARTAMAKGMMLHQREGGVWLPSGKRFQERLTIALVSDRKRFSRLSRAYVRFG